MTMKNVPIALGFATITASQFVLGIVMLMLAAMKGGKTGFLDGGISSYLGRLLCSIRPRVAQPLPPIPLDAYHLCVFYRHRRLEVACTSISLLYGSLELFGI